MNVLAIDPGSAKSSYVLWDGARVTRKNELGNDAMIEFLTEYFSLTSLHDNKHLARDTTLAIERVGHYGTGMPAGADVFETCEWIGRFLQCSLCAYSDLKWRLVKRMEVKMFLCGTSRAKDSNIRQAIIDRFGGQESAIGKKASPGPLYGIHSHEWQALALALTVASKELTP